MYFKHLIIIFILFVSTLYSKELEKISLQLDWLHQFQFAGYYIAKEKGFYNDVNLDVNIKEFNSKTNLVDDILNSKSDYAIGKSSLIIDVLENKEILLLSAIYKSSPMVLISLNKSGIRKPFDLINKRIMLTKDAKSSPSIKSMLISQGVTPDNTNILPHSFNIEDLINNKTDAMACYLSNEPYLLKKKGIDFTIHNPSDYGFDFYGGLLFTSKNELNNNSLRVKKFQSASLKAWKYAFENINETAKIIYEKYNTQNKTLESIIFEGETLKKFINLKEGLIGEINHNKIEEIKRLYLLLGITNHNKNFEINELIYNPNKIYLTKEEEEYLKINEIILLTNSNFQPFTTIKNNTIIGSEIDYWNLINKKLQDIGAKTQIVDENSFANKILKNNQNSIKYSFLRNNNNSLKKTITIEKLSIGILTFTDKPFITSTSDLTNKKIAINKYFTFYENLKIEYPEIDFIETRNFKESLNLLSEGKVFGVIDKLALLSYSITKNSLTNMKISGTLDKKIHMNFLVNKENPILLNILNKTISAISNKEKNEINKKYYSVIYKSTIDYSWVYKIVIPLLIILFIVIILNFRLNKEIHKRKKIERELNKIVNIDSLTNIYNRRKIESLYENELARIKRYKRDLSVIFFDLDNFKQVNDSLGHAVGDHVLVKIAYIVKDNIRKEDFFGRWGGEEFLIVLPETNKEEALKVASILRDKISSYNFCIDRKITCSFGVSQFRDLDSTDSLLTRADNAMYYVKRNGKNEIRVV